MTSFPAAFAPQDLTLRRPTDRTQTALLAALCFFSALLGRFCFLQRPFDNDAAIFIYMGKMVCVGGRLGHDLIDNKFPTVGLMMSVLYRTLGTSWAAYVLLQTITSLVTAWLLGRTAAGVVGDRARLPTMLFAVVFLNFTTAVFGGFQLETMLVFFTALAAMAGIQMLQTGSLPDAFTAGLCAGCGVMFKPTALGVLLALSIALCIGNRKPFLPLAFMSLGVFLPVAASFLYLQQADLLRDMPALYHQISTYAHQTVFDATELIKPLTALLLLGFPILIQGYVFRRQRDPNSAFPKLPITIFLLLWLTIETIGIIQQRRMYAYHFLPMVAPAALLFGMLPRLNKPGTLAASLVPIVLLSVSQAGHIISITKPAEDRLELSNYLATHAKPGDAVWMDAWPRLVLETGLRPAGRLPFTFLFTNYDYAGLDYSAQLIEDFKKTRPAYIILPIPLDRRLQRQIDYIPELNRRPLRRENYLTGWQRIEQYTLANYVKETTIDSQAVYHRRGE